MTPTWKRRELEHLAGALRPAAPKKIRQVHPDSEQAAEMRAAEHRLRVERERARRTTEDWARLHPYRRPLWQRVREWISRQTLGRWYQLRRWWARRKTDRLQRQANQWVADGNEPPV